MQQTILATTHGGPSQIVNLSSEQIRTQGVKVLIAWVRKHNRWGLDNAQISRLTRSQIEDLLLRDILPPPVPTPAPSADRSDKVAGVLNDLQALLNSRPEIDAETIRAIVHEEIDNRLPREIEITVTNGDKVATLTGTNHYRTPIALKMIAAGVNVLFWGPAGSGKTTLAMKAAEALGVAYAVQSFSPATQSHELIGYMSPAGQYIPGSLYRAMTAGHLLILDEFDAADPGVGLLVNAAIASKVVTFPNGETVKAAEGFRAIACMNTRGTGATVEYCGRNALDAATLDRFAALEIDYCRALEDSLIGIKSTPSELDIEKGGTLTAEQWAAFVRKVRAKIEELRLPAVISPRATAAGWALLSQGLGLFWVTAATVFKGLTTEQVKRIEEVA
jgi:cobaltochelatase CobS